MPAKKKPAFSPRLAAAEALAWAASLRGVLVDEKARARAEVLAQEQYDLAAYVVQLIIHDKAREMLRAVGQAIRSGEIPARWDNPDTPGQLITTGLANYDPRIAFQASLRTAYAAGREERIERDPGTTHKIYRTMRDSRVRDSHRALDGLVLPKNDPAWKTITAPNGWRCRCMCYGVDAEGIEKLRARGVPIQEQMPKLREVTHVNKRTGERETLPEGVEPGWGTRPGTAENKSQLAKLLIERQKILLETPDLADM